MAAEDGTGPKGKRRAGTADRRARSGSTIDLEATAAAPAGETAAGAGDSTPADPQADRGAEPGPASEGPADPEPRLRDTDAAAASARSERAPRRAGAVALALAGAVGGLVALALGYGLQATGILPAPGRTVANEALAEATALRDTVSAFDRRVTAIEAADAQAIADRALLDDLSRQVGVVDAFGTSLSDRLLSAEASIAGLKEEAGDGGADTRQQLDALSERVARLESAGPSNTGEGPSAAIEELSRRIDAIEAELARIAAQPPARAVQAPPTEAEDLAAFREAAAQGGPFAAELERLDDLGVRPATLAAPASPGWRSGRAISRSPGRATKSAPR
jgi:hypothetical protein